MVGRRTGLYLYDTSAYRLNHVAVTVLTVPRSFVSFLQFDQAIIFRPI